MNHYVDKNTLKLQCHLYEFAARRNKCKILLLHKTNTIVCCVAECVVKLVLFMVVVYCQ